MTQPSSSPPRRPSPTPPLSSPAGKPPRRAHNAPALSPDEWGAVAQHLAVPDLVSLSEASRTLYLAATQEAQFRARVPRRALSAPRPWSRLFRRYAALQHEPVRERASACVHAADGVCAVADSLIFYSDDLGRLVALPSGWRRAIGPGMGERVVPLGPRSLAVVRGAGTPSHPASLQVFDACTGRPHTAAPLPLPTDIVPDATFTRGRTRRPLVAMSAGRDGNHLLFAREGVAHVVCAATGALARSWRLGSGGLGFGAFVRAEDTRCDGDGDGGERVIAVCLRCAHDTGGARYELLDVVSGRGTAPLFELAESERLVDVVASRDGRWIARRVVKDSRCAVVWSSRRTTTACDARKQARCAGSHADDGEPDEAPPFAVGVHGGGAGVGPLAPAEWEERRHNVGWAGGTFAQPSSEFGLGADGGEARFMPVGRSSIGGVEVDGRVMRVVYGEHGEMVDHVGGVRRINGGAFDWARVSGDGRVLMAACRRLGIVSIFVLNEPRRALHSVRCDEGLRETWLVGDHWIVGVGLSGRLYEWHFSAFCAKRGAHADADAPRAHGEALLDGEAADRGKGGQQDEEAREKVVLCGAVRGLARCRSPLSGARDEWFVAGRRDSDDGGGDDGGGDDGG